ncbi:MAG: beta-galactosidase [Caulobacteraceae bacterium]|nr:beta-galactosidase [Caulobacter sp.]
MTEAGGGLTRRGALGATGLGAAGLAAGALAQAPAAAAARDPAAPATLLYPHESPTRTTRDLSGLWRFKPDPQDAGVSARWFDGLEGARAIPVPCSWNDLFDDLAEYFGPAWYENDVWVEPQAPGRRMLIRFGSAMYRADVWLNGTRLGGHEGGHLPFAFDVTAVARPGEANRLSVRVENELKIDRVPASPDPVAFRYTQEDYPQTAYDFFPYAGLHRQVWLQALPATHLHDLRVVTTALAAGRAEVSVELEVAGGWSGPVEVRLEGAGAPAVARGQAQGGRARLQLSVPGVRAWSPADPFLYALVVAVGGGARPLDVYRMPQGLRTVKVEGSRILLNGEPVFLKGFGKHEDFVIHGKGLDLPVLVRDFELLRWIGANSFRTSHYPYAEEAMMLADRYGYMVIDEGPGVSLIFGDPPEVVERRAAQLERALGELVARDKNHACVVLWSVANEPILKPFHTSDPAPVGAVEAGTRVFQRLFAAVRAADPSRPVALVSVQGGPAEWVGQGDVICANSYFGWYAVSGRIGDAAAALEKEVTALRARHGDKPIVYTEFGADALAGAHSQPPVMWTEEYQAELVAAYWQVLRRHPYVVGTHPWAFADFKAVQSVMRVEGLNQKGVFTRDRRPKLTAHRLRELWRA